MHTVHTQEQNFRKGQIERVLTSSMESKMRPGIWIGPNQMKRLVSHCKGGDLNGVKREVYPYSEENTIFRMEEKLPRHGWDSMEGRALILYSEPTIEAAKAGHEKIVKYFIKKFACIATKPLRTARPCALHEAAALGHKNVLKVIVDAGFPVEHRDLNGQLALFRAVQHKKVEAVKYLVSQYSTVNILTEYTTSLLVSCFHSTSHSASPAEIEIVRCLLENGLDLGWLVKQQINPVQQILERSCVAIEGEILQLLLRHNSEAMMTFFIGNYQYSNLPLALVATARGWNIQEIAENKKCPASTAAQILISIAVNKIISTSASVAESLSPDNIDLLWKAFKMQDRQGFKAVPGEMVEIGAEKDSEKPKEERITSDTLSVIIEDTQMSGDPTDLYHKLICLLQEIYGQSHAVIVLAMQKACKALCQFGLLDSAEKIAVKGLNVLVHTIKNQPNFHEERVWWKENESFFSFIHEFLESCKSHKYNPDFSMFVELGDQIVSCYKLRLNPGFLLSTEQIFILIQMWRDSTTDFFPTPEAAVCFRKLFSSISIMRVLRSLNVDPKNPPSLLTSVLPLLHGLNTMDIMGNRPLHSCAKMSYRRDAHRSRGILRYHIFEDKYRDILESYIPILVNSGAHLDAVNSDGKTAYELCNVNAPFIHLLKPPQPLSLVCQAARAVVSSRIEFRKSESLPPKMKDFINLHDHTAPQAKFSHSLF